MRYRRPSLKTMLGVTKVRRRLNRDLGIDAIRRPFRARQYAERRIKRRAGLLLGADEVPAVPRTLAEEVMRVMPAGERGWLIDRGPRG
jgi:hypothetical protein